MTWSKRIGETAPGQWPLPPAVSGVGCRRTEASHSRGHEGQSRSSDPSRPAWRGWATAARPGSVSCQWSDAPWSTAGHRSGYRRPRGTTW